MLSHFGPEEIAKTCRLISGLEIPYGGTLGDLIAITDEDCMTKMLVEERVMECTLFDRPYAHCNQVVVRHNRRWIEDD